MRPRRIPRRLRSRVDIDYVGFDPNPKYISSARVRFSDADLYIGTTESVRDDVTGTFDLAVAMGVLHHVDDETAEAIAEFAHSKLHEGGRFLTIDPVLLDRQHPVARVLTRLDRGKHVRRLHQYQELIAGRFGRDAVTTTAESGWLRVPYNHAVVIAVR